MTPPGGLLEPAGNRRPRGMAAPGRREMPRTESGVQADSPPTPCIARANASSSLARSSDSPQPDPNLSQGRRHGTPLPSGLGTQERASRCSCRPPGRWPCSAPGRRSTRRPPGTTRRHRGMSGSSRSPQPGQPCNRGAVPVLTELGYSEPAAVFVGIVTVGTLSDLGLFGADREERRETVGSSLTGARGSRPAERGPGAALEHLALHSSV